MIEIPKFLMMEHVKAVHQKMIAEFGGITGIRDMGLLESAVMMPRACFGGSYLHETIGAMSAAYLFHICRNHAFLDGNKRAALASAEVFANINGFELGASDDELEKLTLGVAESRIPKEEVIAFLEARLSKPE